MSQLGSPLRHSVRGETRSTSAASTTPLAPIPRTWLGLGLGSGLGLELGLGSGSGLGLELGLGIG